jgi:P pilus assembly chaperone PapD
MFSYMFKNQFTALLFMVLLVVAVPVKAQISIAPTMMFVHENPGVGEIYLTNTSAVTQEISFGYQFGYPSSSEDGQIFMVYDDSVGKQQWGLAEFIRMYPSQVIIEPGQSQAVRVQILPMRDREDGVYWTRLLVESSPVTPDVQDTGNEGISTSINYVLEQNIPIFYRKGNNDTGVKVNDTRLVEQADTIIVKAEVQRTGNSPYLGMMYVRLYGGNDRKLAEKEVPAYFYFNDWRSFAFNKAEVGEGPYRVEFEFETKRKSLSSSDIVTADKHVHSVKMMD